jgi:uncharacterized membrane protein YphA (DoxX/SURF4 family)
MSKSIMKWLYLSLRIAFGILLIAASIDKWLHPREFGQIVANYRLIGLGFSYWIAIFIPCFESLVGLLLIIGLWSDTTTMINALLMSLFLVVVFQAFIRGLDIACGCFTIGEEKPIDIWKLIQNMVFTALGWTTILLRHRLIRTEPIIRTPMNQ